MITFDLKTLPGWETLAPGKHTLQIVAIAENLIDSYKSDPIEFTRGAEYDYKFNNNVLQIYKVPYTFTDGVVRIGG